MKIVSFIERHQKDVIEKILRHCNLWKEQLPRPSLPDIVPKLDEPKLDYGFFEQTCLCFPLHVNRALNRPGSDMHFFFLLF